MFILTPFICWGFWFPSEFFVPVLDDMLAIYSSSASYGWLIIFFCAIEHEDSFSRPNSVMYRFCDAIDSGSQDAAIYLLQRGYPLGDKRTWLRTHKHMTHPHPYKHTDTIHMHIHTHTHTYKNTHTRIHAHTYTHIVLGLASSILLWSRQNPYPMVVLSFSSVQLCLKINFWV